MNKENLAVAASIAMDTRCIWQARYKFNCVRLKGTKGNWA
jgi:hypothetical protein